MQEKHITAFDLSQFVTEYTAPVEDRSDVEREYLQRDADQGRGSGAVLVTVTEGEEAAPRSSNTGCPHTQGEGQEPPEGEISTCIDWTSFTFPDGTDWKDVARWLSLTEAISLPYGRNGYRSAERQGHVTIFHDGNVGMGVHVAISGQGCRELEACGRVQDWQAFFKEAIERGAKFTRIDWAFDDRIGLLDLGEIERKLDEGEVTTLFRKHRPVEGDRTIGEGRNQQTGKTIYIGKRESDSFIRVYDKAAEQGVPGLWVRFEYVTRKQVANVLAAVFASGGLVEVVKYIGGLITFKEPGADSNRSRWASCAWWVQFLGTSERLRLRIAHIVATLADKVLWVKKQVSPTLALIMLACGGDLGVLEDIVREGLPRIKASQLAQLQSPSCTIVST